VTKQDNTQQAPTQEVVFFPKAHEELLKGASVLASAVASTMGPSGHSVIIDMEVGPPQITKDGVTVARSIKLKNRLQSMGAELLKEIASKTNDLAGDGTTTATVLGHSMLAEGMKMISTNRSSISLKKGMDIATNHVMEYLKLHSIPVSSRKDIVNVGTISANGDRSIGELLAKAIEKVGKDGIITIEPTKSTQTTLDIVEGMQIDCGYVSPFFITNSEKAICELDNPNILITPNKISSIQDILKVLEGVAGNSKSLLIIADDVEGDALHTLIVNKTKGVLKVCAVKAPSYGEHRSDILSDIQVLVGGTVFGASTDISIKNATIEHLGTAKKVIIGRGATTIIGTSDEEKKVKLEERIVTLRKLLADGSLDALHVDKTRKRLARLSGGIAVIRVGGSTEIEILEKKDRVEDAVNATLAATQEGIVPGGGTALFYAAQELKKNLKTGEFFGLYDADVIAGIEMIANVCEAPLRTIVKNTGISSDIVAEKLTQSHSDHKIFYVDVGAVQPEDMVSYIEAVKKEMAAKVGDQDPETVKFRFGYNAATGKYLDLVSEGIIDPVKVTRYALEHATSVIGLVLTCNSVIVNEEE
jgi:chaperonin GroEL